MNSSSVTSLSGTDGSSCKIILPISGPSSTVWLYVTKAQFGRMNSLTTGSLSRFFLTKGTPGVQKKLRSFTPKRSFVIFKIRLTAMRLLASISSNLSKCIEACRMSSSFLKSLAVSLEKTFHSRRVSIHCFQSVNESDLLAQLYWRRFL